jgi:hypothetical protein
MSVTGYTSQISASGHGPEEHLPGIFIGFASLGFVLVLLSIVLSVYLSPMENPALHFRGNGLNTALSAICMSMAAVAAALVFYLRSKNFSYGALFWLVLAGACVVFSLDAQLALDGGGADRPGNGIGGPGPAGQWTGTILYCAGAAAVLGLFAREIRTSRTFVILLAVAAVFFVIHAGIDGLVPNRFIWKDVPSQGSRLIAVFFLLLATTARLVLLIEQLPARRRFG